MMLERYLLSTLASKLGHIFEDFDENTTAELHAWRGVLVLRNLHLRKDALIQLGVPPLDIDGLDDEDDGDILDDDGDFYDDAGSSCPPDTEDVEDGESSDSDDDSFRSCASHLTEDDDNASTRAREPSQGIPPKNISSPETQSHGPTIEVAYGYIGSLEFHIPWRLLRPIRASAPSPQTNNDDEDNNLKCSAVLSDVRILLAPSNHTRNQSKCRNCAPNPKSTRRDPQDCPSTIKSRKLSALENMQMQRELAVQSLLERELFRHVRVVNEGGKSDDASTETSGGGWLARWAKGLAARILSSLQVTVQNIHIRFEDEGYGWFEQNSQHRHQYRPAFAMGIHLVDFALRNADPDEDNPCGSSDTSNGLDINAAAILRRKAANVENLSVYWDSHHPDLFIGYVTDEEDGVYYEKRFAELDILYSDEFKDAPQQHTYLIQPISPSLHLTMVDRPNSETIQEVDSCANNITPSIHITFRIPSFHIGFDRNTLEDIAYIRRCLSGYKARIVSSKKRVIDQLISEQLSRIRPHVRIRGNPRIWWRYAIRAVRILQSDRSHFEGRVWDNKREWRRDRWLSLARLLQLRNKYTAVYHSFMSAPVSDVERRRKFHIDLLTLEDLLNVAEITALRIAVLKKLLGSQDIAVNVDTLASDSSHHHEPASMSLSVLSVEYRGMKIQQIIRSIDLDQDEFLAEDGLKPPVEVDSWKSNSSSPICTVSMEFQDLTAQANDNSQAYQTLRHVSAQYEQPEIVPIVRLHCKQTLRFEKWCNGSWNLTAELSSLTLSDLISPFMKKASGEQPLIRMKQSTFGHVDTDHSDIEHTAKVAIRNAVSDETTIHETFVEVTVSPLAFTYSTIAFEALSRLCIAMKTDEFNRDYERISRALSRWGLRQRELLISVLSRRRKQLVVSIDIAAPVLHIPQDLQNTESPTLVVNLGRLTFRSESEPPPTGFDDKWLLQVDSISAHSLHSKSHDIIEPFSLKFSIVSHIAEGGPTTINMTKIHVQAVLPQLHFNLTTSSVRLVSSLQLSWNDAKLRHRLLPPRQTLDEFLLSNRESAQWHTDQTSSSGNVHEDVISSEVIVSKAVQEIKFIYSAPIISLQIVNDVDFDQPRVRPSCLIPLMNLSIRGICGSYVSQSSETGGVTVQISARLRSVHAQDIQQSDSQLRHFLSSIDPILIQICDPALGMNSGDEDLVVVEVSKNPNADQDISIHFHELYVEWNPELLARVQKSLRCPQQLLSSSANRGVDAEFFDALDYTASYNTNSSDEKEDLNETADVAREHHKSQATDVAEVPSPQFSIVFHLSQLRVNFNKDSQNRCLFSVDMNQTDISYHRKPLGGAITTATVANARLRDSGEVSGGTLYGQMIGLQSGNFTSSSAPTSSIVHMSFESFTRQNDQDSEFHNMMKLNFSEMKFVYIHQLWLEIFDYVFEGVLGHAVWGSKPKPVPSASNRGFKRTKMSIHMEQPLLLLPICYRSPHHIRLKLKSLTVMNHFTRDEVDGKLTSWTQWFNNCQLKFRDLNVLSWDERNLNDVVEGQNPPSLTLNIRWPVGPTAILVKPKWNVAGRVDPIVFCLTRRDFSLFRFFVSYNLLESSRCLAEEASVRDESQELETLVLFGYEKTGVPPTTYSLNCTFSSLIFQFLLDEEESENKSIEGMMDVICSNAAWSLIKDADCISKQSVNVDSIRLTQTSNRIEWLGFPDLLLPITAREDQTNDPHRLFQFTSITHPNGNNVKMLHLDAAGIYLIVPAWQHVVRFFQKLATSPEVFTSEEMTSIMQVGDRFYRVSSRNDRTTKLNDRDSTEVNNEGSFHQVAVSKQFLVTLASPQIILVADASVQGKKCPRLTLSMSHLNILRQTTIQDEINSVFCDGLEIFTETASGSLPRSSVICPVHISGSLRKSYRSTNHPQSLLGWVWIEELFARASYTDLTLAIDVLNGTKEQLASPETAQSLAQPKINKSLLGSADEENREVSGRINIDVLCERFKLVITDDSYRQFANAQPLVGLLLAGMRFSQSADAQEANHTQASLTPGPRLVKNTFVSIDSLELSDLLRQEGSPFRIMAASSHPKNSKQGTFSFTSHIELDKMSWQSHHMIASTDWGFQLSPSMEKRRDAVRLLTPPKSHFDSTSNPHSPFMVFSSSLHDNGCRCIDTNIQNLTAQWNPSTVIALQRFLGRLKKASHSIRQTTAAGVATNTNESENGRLPSKIASEQSSLIFSVNINIESICMYLNKEYQQRHLLDAFLTGAMIKFERWHDHSLLLQASVQNLKAWDSDMTKPTSDRNRHILRQIQDGEENISSDPFFSFQYRTFKSFSIKVTEQVPFADWVEMIEDIDDILTVKSRPFEFVYCRDTISELTDYLNNGLPGKGMGATSKAAQSFCANRIRTRSFFDFTFEQPCVFIPRAPSSSIGGCHLTLGTVRVKSWFEEARDHRDERNLYFAHSPSFSNEVDESLDKMDWWRVLDISLRIGIKIEVSEAVTGVLSDKDTVFNANLIARKPSSEETTIIQCSASSLDINLKYTEFMILNLVALENIGQPIDESKWDNIEKSYWQNECDAAADAFESSLVYADTARIVRFGETNTSVVKEGVIHFGFLVDSINVTLHRDDWLCDPNEDNDILCYDICIFSIQKMVLTIGMHRNGNKTASIALYDMSFTDVGDYGRLARDLYIGSYDPKRPCAFSTVAEGYGPSSEEPLVLFVFGRQTSSRDDVWGEVANNIDLKVNSLSVTVLPRSIEDVLCFVSRKWSCRNSNLEVKSVVTRFKSSQKITDGPTASANETLRFKFVAVYPRLILLADETDPYSRALVLRGLAVGNMSIIRDTSSSLYKYGQVDMRGSTSLSGHIKELETYVHNNIDSLIGPDRSLSDDDSIGVALVEPVTVTVEVRIESRSRFPTSRYVSIDIEPVAILLSFGDLSLINAISRKSFRKQKEMSKKNDLESQTRLHSPSLSSQVCSPQFSNSSDYSQCEEMQLVFDVAIVTKRLGLHLRKSGSSIIVESSQCNDKVESGDILLAVNGQSVERMPLASVVNLFDNIPRPLTITLSRQVRHQSSATNDISTKTSDSYAIDAHSFHVSSSDEVGKDVELDTSVPGMITTRFDVKICGIPTGLELKSGLGGTAVVNNVDYELFARCAPSISATCRQWPLPGALLLAIDGKEMNFEEISNVLDANEKSVEQDSSFTFSFVEADSIGNISNFEGRMSFVLTVIDDTNGRDMPVLRAGLHDTSFTANHGLATATKSIVARRPAILSVYESSVFEEDEAAVLTLESKVLSFNLDFNNAIVNEWEPLIEPHCLAATIERQSGNPRSPGQCSFVIRDQIDCSEHGPLEFVCVNVSDSAVNMLSTAAKSWRKRKNSDITIGSPATPQRTTPSPHFFPSTKETPTTASAAELRKATKLAKLALNFSRKRGQSAYKEELAPFVFRNRLGMQVNFSASGISTTIVDDGEDAQFHMHPVSSRIHGQKDRRMRRYDGHFPTVDIEPYFGGLDTACSTANECWKDVHANPVTDLPTGKVGTTLRSVRIWKKKGDSILSQQILVYWEVKLEENRRVLILSSATNIKVFGSMSAIEVGVRFSNDDNGVSGEIATVGTTSQEGIFLPLWVESCFRSVEVFIRPLVMDAGACIYTWSTFPILCLNSDGFEVGCNWIAESVLSSGGVSCPLNRLEDQHIYNPVWLQCSYSYDSLNGSGSSPSSVQQHDNHVLTSVTIWSAITIRNMLPCNVEWEVSASVRKDEDRSIFDSSTMRAQQCSQSNSTSSPRSSLQCGNAVEIFAANAQNRELHARFKCIAQYSCYWSEWVSVGLDYTAAVSQQINLQCANGSCIGVKLSPRWPGKGVTLILYAEIWLRNMTTIPLTFGAPSLQVGSDRYIKSLLPSIVSADSALLEITSVLDGNSFGIFGNDDDDDEDLGTDVINLPIQQCNEVYEEVFEYVSLNERGNVERRWWASENHVSLRQNPNDDTTDKANWLIDCAGEPLLQDGWESCANIAGSKSFTFNGRRHFNKQHRFRRRRWFRVIRAEDNGSDKDESICDKVIFHQPADLDRHARAKREAERNALGAQLDATTGDAIPNLLDVFTSSPRDEGVLDIMTRVANDGSILIYVKQNDGRWSTPVIIPPSGSSFGVIRLYSSRWPLVTKAIKEQRRKGDTSRGYQDGCDTDNLGISPLEPTVFELIYQVTIMSGVWGELSRMVTITPRFLIHNESSWLDIDVKQVGAPDTSRSLVRKGETLPFHWFDTTLPELICIRPTQSRHRFKWSGGFDVCTLGMIAIRVRRIDGTFDQLNLRSMRVNIELQPGSGGSGTTVSIRDEDPVGEGSLFRIENHTPFRVFLSQDGVLANPTTWSDPSALSDVVQPGERTSYALDVPWRQGKYAGRTSASMSELLLLRCALAPLSTREGVESTKVISFAKVGDYVRLSPSKLSPSIGSDVATELLGVRVLGVIGTDGPTRTLRFILMQKEVTTSSYIGNAVRDTISPMPSFMSAEGKSLHDKDSSRSQVLFDATQNALQLLSTGELPNERDAIKQAFFGTGACKRSPLSRLGEAHTNLGEESTEISDDITCEFNFSGFVISIIDSSPTELAVLSLHSVKVGASWSSSWKEYARGRISMTWLQLDNHCPNSAYPVAIRPRVKTDWESDNGGEQKKSAFTGDKPFMEMVIDLAPPHRTGIQSLSAGASLHDVEIYVDLAFILRIQRFLLCLQDHLMDTAGSNRTHDFVDSQNAWRLPNLDQLAPRSSGKMFYHFRRLTILPFEVKLSVAPARALTLQQEEFEGVEASAIHAAVRKGDLLVGEGTGVLGVKIGSKNRSVISVVQGMMKSILVDALLRCDGASLNFEGVALFNHTSNSLQLVTYLGAHYLASLIGNVPSLIGSLAAFGNPLGLIRDLGDGVSDFVNEPVRGLKRSIEEMDPSFVMTGLARGTESLARHTLGGFADSAAMLTETAAKNMAVLTLDRKYAQRRDRVMKFKATDAKAVTLLKGLESGMQKLVNGILDGVTGVVSKPIRGAERNGLEGFAKGVGKGLLGLIMKPVVGATDLITDTLMGVKGSVEGTSDVILALHSQVRPRRALYGRDRVVKPYRPDDATAATIQAKLRSIGGEEYFSHVDMINNVALMSVTKMLILSEEGEELLLLQYSDIKRVEVQPQIEAAGFLVKIYLHGPDACKVVECVDENIANLLCEKLNQVYQPNPTN